MSLKHNQQQYDAINLDMNSSGIIVAGPGSGKTRTTIERIDYLLKNGYKTDELLIITFTNNAVDEIKKRLHFSDHEKFKYCGTLHSLVKRIIEQEYLEEFCELYELKIEYLSIFDDYDFYRFIQLVAFKMSKKRTFLTQKESDLLANYVFKRKLDTYCLKYELITKEEIDEDLSVVKKFDIKQLDDLYQEYEEILRSKHQIDFLDIFIYFYQIAKKHTEKFNKTREKFKYILVDEFQDLNLFELEIIKLFSSDGNNLFVVGDPNQSIYGFTGACGNVFSKLKSWFEQKNAQHKIIPLTENYRSSKKIVEFSNTSIKKNPNFTENDLFTNNQEGENVKIFSFKNESSDFFIDEITKLIDSGFKASQIGILYRSNWLAENIKRQLFEKKFKFVDMKLVKHINGANSLLLALIISYSSLNVEKNSISKAILFFLSREKIISFETYSEITKTSEDIDYLSKWELAFNEEEKKYIKTIFEIKNKYISRSTAIIYEFKKFLRAFCQEIYSENSKIKDFFKFTTYNSAVAEIEAFLRNFSEMFRSDWKNLKEFLLILFTYVKKACPEFFVLDDYVVMSTIHSSKGCEYDCVFLTHLSEEYLPDYRAKKESEIQEERRIFYVGLTRARKNLYLISYSIDKNRKPLKISRFLTEIKKDVEHICDIDDGF